MKTADQRPATEVAVKFNVNRDFSLGIFAIT
jgi:hypothetical protein